MSLRWAVVLVCSTVTVLAGYGRGRAEPDYTRRAVLILAVVTRAESTLASLKKNDASITSDRVQRLNTVVSAYLKLFMELEKEKLLDEKLEAYRRYFTDLNERFGKNHLPERNWRQLPPSEAWKDFKLLVDAFDQLGKDLLMAAKPEKCTVIVSASVGDGASAKYVKAADAGKKDAVYLGEVTVAREVERATYVFYVFRNGTETGKSAPVECTDVKAPVKVTVRETEFNQKIDKPIKP